MAAAGFKIAALALVCVGCTSIAADARTFEGTSWHATAINGRATPPTGDYVIRFDEGRIGGHFGCNLFGGEYRVQREVMTASAIRSTMMACMEPAASFESQSFAILDQPMRMSWSSSRKLTLSNPAGSVVLELVP